MSPDGTPNESPTVNPTWNVREQAAAYALGALGASERVEFEAAMAADAAVRAEVEAYREVAGLMALAVAPVAPRDGAALRERIVRAASEVRPITSGVSSGTSRTHSSSAPRAGAAASALPTPAAARRIQEAGTPWARRVPWLAAAASLVVAVGAGTGLLASRNEEARLTRALELARADATGARDQLAARDSVLAAFMGPMVHVVSLAPGEAEKPSARVFWNHTANVFVVTAFNVPPAPEGKTYQLWAIRKGKAPISMGTFNTDPSGRALAVVPVGTIGDAGFIDNCALTLEPVGGSAQPTETPRLLGVWRHVD